jgi:circadian clock protein KaiC
MEITRIKTGIRNLDEKILGGGIPAYSVNIIGGSPGSGKTIFTQQILFHNASPQVKTIYFTTVSEPTAKLIHYQQAFSYFDEQKIRDGLVSYVDIGHVIHKKGLTAGIDTITQAIDEHSASIVAIDSFKAINELAESVAAFRQFAYGLCVELIAWRCTSFLVGEYTLEDFEKEPIFAIADGIITLEQSIKGLQNKRFLTIPKMRGVKYFEGVHSFDISEEGITVFPRTTPLHQTVIKQFGDRKVSTGIKKLDEMMDGGLPHSSATLIAGGTGTGKTTMGLHFLTCGAENDEPGILVTFEESPAQLYVMAKSLGWNLKKLEDKGLLKILYISPVELNLDELAEIIKTAIDEMDAQRIVIDTLTDIEIESEEQIRYRDYIYSLVNFFKSKGITSMLLNETVELLRDSQLSDCGISFIADNAIMLNYVRTKSNIKRVLSVLKIRGSGHVTEIKEFEITSSGMRISN